MSFCVFLRGSGGYPPGGSGARAGRFRGPPPAGGGPGGLLQRFCLRSLFLGVFRHFLGWDPPGTPLGPPWDPPGTPPGPPWDPPWDPPIPGNPLPQTRAFLDPPPPPTPLGPPSDPPDTPSQEFARFWSQIQKTREKIACLTGTRADPGVPLIWGVFGGKLSLSRGGRSLRLGGVSEDYFAFKIEKHNPPLTKTRL